MKIELKGRIYYSSPVGELIIESENEKIITLGFLKDSKQEEIQTSIIDQCVEELEEYFLQGRKFFSFDMNLIGTEFQVKVWNELLNILSEKLFLTKSWPSESGTLNQFALLV